MTVHDPAPFPGAHSAAGYWEQRARRYATTGDGLAAVCSYGMPGFDNAAIELAQRRALERWLAPVEGSRVLDVGCGIGRWSRRLAASGARVTGVDLSPTMVAEARRRAAGDGVAERCRFHVADLTELDLGQRFDLVVGVTVLQHILAAAALAQAVGRLAAHLEPDGRMVLLEAAPSRPTGRLDSPVFTARDTVSYERSFTAAGLALEAVDGVDPAPFRRLFLPVYRRLPRSLAVTGLALADALSVPLDRLLAARWVSASWHKVFVLRASEGGGG